MISLFSIHYFLWYGALTSISGYESVYAHQYTNATTLQYGYLNAVLPFITVLVTPFVCSRADRLQTHRNYFTLSLIATTVALSLYGILPITMPAEAAVRKMPQVYQALPPRNISSASNIKHRGVHRIDVPLSVTSASYSGDGLLWKPWIFYCIISLLCDLSVAINTCLADSFAVLQAEERDTSFGCIIVWGTFGWAASAMLLSLINTWTPIPRLVPGLLLGTTLLAADSLLVTYWNRPDDFKLDMLPPEAAAALTGSMSASKHREPSDYMPRNEPVRINLGLEPEEPGSTRLRRRLGKSPMLARSAAGVSGRGASVSAQQSSSMLASSSAYVSERPTSSAESQLSIKTIKSSPDVDSAVTGGFGGAVRSTTTPTTTNSKSPASNFSSLAPPVSSAIVAVAGKRSLKPSQAQKMKEDEAVAAGKGATTLKDQQQVIKQLEPPVQMPSFGMQMHVLWLIMRRRKALIRYFVLFVISGFFMSMQWNYFFLYLDIIYHDKFEMISALSMVGQSMLGELPFFILSKRLIDLLGRSHTLSISLITIGIRFLLYTYLLPGSSIYCVFLADFWQGPNYGLFYVVMTEVGLEYSYCNNSIIETLCREGKLDRNNQKQIDIVRLSVRSTVASVAYACYEGVGVGLGSLVGGFILHSEGFKSLWLSMAIAAIAIGVGNIFLEYLCGEACDLFEHRSVRDFVAVPAASVGNRYSSRSPDTVQVPESQARPSVAAETTTAA